MAHAAISYHQGGDRMIRHRHAAGYAALVLSGGYVEAGDRGRIRVESGHVVVHAPYEAHQNDFAASGATVLNLPLVDHLPPGIGQIDDVDAIARLAERDPHQAAIMVRDTLRPASTALADWPDLLATALSTAPDFALAEWADRMGLAPQSVSRGFRRIYGTSPKRYRLEQRAHRAIRALAAWNGSIAALAADLGFADQAHLTRTISALTGAAPHRLKVQSVQEQV